MFHHADADNPVEGFVDVTVVLQPDFDGQAATEIFREGFLFLGNGHPDDAATVVFRGVLRQAAPAATDVQHAQARLEAELAAD